ncbi:hypothetical protein ACJX0J_013200, partial [Zea mays]
QQPAMHNNQLRGLVYAVHVDRDQRQNGSGHLSFKEIIKKPRKILPGPTSILHLWEKYNFQRMWLLVTTSGITIKKEKEWIKNHVLLCIENIYGMIYAYIATTVS